MFYTQQGIQSSSPFPVQEASFSRKSQAFFICCMFFSMFVVASKGSNGYNKR